MDLNNYNIFGHINYIAEQDNTGGSLLIHSKIINYIIDIYPKFKVNTHA